MWSPPWHLYILLLANLLAFYLTYLLAFYLAFYLAYLLAYLLAYYLLKSSGILPGKHSGTLSGISSGILSDILSGILSGIPSGILSGISPNILSGIPPGTLSGISYGILSGISSRILSDILSGISSGILSGFWGPAVRTELGMSQVEVQRCALSWEGPRLRSSGGALSWEGARLRSSSAHWALKLAKSLAKSRQGNSGRGSGGRGGRRGGGRGGGGRRRMRRTALIKSNPHLAGGEQRKPVNWGYEPLTCSDAYLGTPYCNLQLSSIGVLKLCSCTYLQLVPFEATKAQRHVLASHECWGVPHLVMWLWQPIV